MSIWKNTEVRRTALWLLLATAVCSVAAALLYPICGLLTLGLGAVCGAIWYGSRRRYRELERMSRDIDRILHGQEQQMLPQQEEGELAILRSEIGKMTVRLRENAQRQQEERVRLADAMADISHQLRTPLTAMRLTLSLLEQEELTPQRRLALMRELKKLTGRMEWLVEALLKMAQLDAGTVVFHPQDTTAAELVRRAAEPLEVPMEVRSIRFTAQAGEERLTCDVPWSTEALGNILKNCMEHAASWVQVTARETAIFTEITVQDDGPGFDPEELPRLFQRFYRGKNAGENNFGIGLSLSRQVLAQQNGTVQAENVLTGGARFILRWYKGTI
jgi:signal transduction histidine kinase